jgi:hypothetical protein
MFSFLFDLAKKILPSVSKEKDKLKSVDTLISKRGNVTKGEVYFALAVKLINLLIYAYIVWAIINGKLDLIDTIKLLCQ